MSNVYNYLGIAKIAWNYVVVFFNNFPNLFNEFLHYLHLG